MMALALFSLFALGALASVLVLADSGLRAVQAWRCLRSELRAVTGQCGSALVQADAPLTGRVVTLDCRAVMQNGITQDGWRAAA